MEGFKVLALVFALVAFVTAQAEEVSDRCLGCICEASSNCQKDIGCTSGNVCGPMLISWPFWVDGGKFVIKGTDPGSSKAYSECANDLYCAGATVRGYAMKYKRDCNGDGRVTCEDFARLHKLGYGSCTDKTFYQTDYYRKFKTCADATNP